MRATIRQLNLPLVEGGKKARMSAKPLAYQQELIDHVTTKSKVLAFFFFFSAQPFRFHFHFPFIQSIQLSMKVKVKSKNTLLGLERK